MLENFISLERIVLKEVMQNAFAGSIQTENLTIAYTQMEAGTEVPLHHHPEEAVDIILEGKLEMTIGGRSDLLMPGMISLVPSNIPHRAVAYTKCRVLTILHPKRKI